MSVGRMCPQCGWGMDGLVPGAPPQGDADCGGDLMDPNFHEQKYNDECEALLGMPSYYNDVGPGEYPPPEEYPPPPAAGDELGGTDHTFSPPTYASWSHLPHYLSLYVRTSHL